MVTVYSRVKFVVHYFLSSGLPPLAVPAADPSNSQHQRRAHERLSEHEHPESVASRLRMRQFNPLGKSLI